MKPADGVCPVRVHGCFNGRGFTPSNFPLGALPQLPYDDQRPQLFGKKKKKLFKTPIFQPSAVITFL